MGSSTFRRPSARACALVSAVAIATLLSACGSDSDSSADSTGVATSDTASDTTDAVTDDTTDGSTVDTGSTGPATRDDYVEAFATNYAIFNDAEQDHCIGETFVTAIGEDQLTASGVAPSDVTGVVLLEDLGLSIDQETLPAAIEDLAACGDLVTLSLASSTATPEETACATDIVSNELASEQLLIQVTGLEPSAELLAAREALNGCAAS